MTGIERWAQTYDRAPGDTIKIQTDIADQRRRGAQRRARHGGKAALTLGGTANAAARDLYLKAEAAQNVAGGEADYRKILALLDSAIAIDANYAAAHAGRSRFLRAIAVEFAATPDLLRLASGMPLRRPPRALPWPPILHRATLRSDWPCRANSPSVALSTLSERPTSFRLATPMSSVCWRKRWARWDKRPSRFGLPIGP